MQTEQNKLIEELLASTLEAIEAAKKFKTLSEKELNFKKSANEWSVLECLEHLNLYGDYYLPEIEKQILAAKPASANIIFRSGILGNYFANLMKVNNGKIKKMKSPKDKNPANSHLTTVTIDRFIKQLEKLKLLLNQSGTVNLTGIKVPTSLSKFIRLRLGDTFRFFVYHIERHILQAQRSVPGRNTTLYEDITVSDSGKRSVTAF